jgi:hypothetical protein
MVKPIWAATGGDLPALIREMIALPRVGLRSARLHRPPNSSPIRSRPPTAVVGRSRTPSNRRVLMASYLNRLGRFSFRRRR